MVKNNERGSFQIAGMLCGALFLVVAVGFIYKYYHDLRLYEEGPRAIARTRTPGKFRIAENSLRPSPAFTITGALRNRHILHKEIPSYPLWAEKEGVSGKVRLVFRVNSEGAVYPNIWVSQTMGHRDFDEAAVQALKQWRFAPARTSRQEPVDMFTEPTPGQAGTIHFTYTLSNRPLQS